MRVEIRRKCVRRWMIEVDGKAVNEFGNIHAAKVCGRIYGASGKWRRVVRDIRDRDVVVYVDAKEASDGKAN